MVGRFERLPGAELIRAGLEDLVHGIASKEALLVCVGSPRLRRLGLVIPSTVFEKPEHRLYRLLAEEDQDTAHSRYNALIRRLISFERAAECAS